MCLRWRLRGPGMLSRDARVLLAGVQGLVGVEWLVSGANKVFSGTFAQGLAAELGADLKDNPNLWYGALLRGVVMPHSLAFGFLIEWTELAIGIALLSGLVLLLARSRPAGTGQSRLEAGELAAVVGAALVGAFLCVNFHFLMGDGLVPSFNPGHPFDEGIDLDTLLPPLSLLIALGNARLIEVVPGWLARQQFGQWLRRVAQTGSERHIAAAERQP